MSWSPRVFARFSAVVLPTVLAAAFTAAAAGPALGQPGSEIDVGDGQVGLTVWSVAASTPIERGTARRGGPRLACGWYPIDVDGSGTLPGAVRPLEGHPYVFACWEGSRPAQFHADTAVVLVARQHQPADPTPAAEVIGADDIARTIVDQRMLDPLPVSVELNPVGDQVVHVETWIHVPDEWTYAPVTAHAGPIEATVSVTPVGLSFDPGDGSPPVECATRGAAYDRSIEPGDQQTDCGYTYRVARAEPYEASVTVTWAVGYSGNNGEAATLPSIAETTVVPIRVRELQAVIS